MNVRWQLYNYTPTIPSNKHIVFSVCSVCGQLSCMAAAVLGGESV